MKTLIIGGLVFGVAIVCFLIYRLVIVRIQNKRLNHARFKKVEILSDKLEKKEDLHKEDILPFAQDISTREITFELLRSYDRADLFPKEYYSIAKGAESNLAIWLEFPTELSACPDEMEYIKRVCIDNDDQDNPIYYEIFQYRVNEPHWAAEDGWMIGVVGPYFKYSKPYDFPKRTFSRFINIENTTAEEEAQWVHQNILPK